MPKTGKKPKAKKLKKLKNPLKNFLKKAHATQNPAGDLIADMRQDKELPKAFASIEEMRQHLLGREACVGAIDAVPVVWKRYEAFLARQ